MEALNERFRHILLFLFAAVIVAALLRHTMHVYGGIAREDIRTLALLIAPAVLFGFLFLAKKR